MFEKVNPAHPDKIADRIAGAIVDLAYARKTHPIIAVEVLIGHGKCHVIIETSVSNLTVEDIHRIIKRIAGDIEADVVIVPQDEHLAKNQNDKLRCGDNGIFKGMPITNEQRALTDSVMNIYRVCPYDGKYILDGLKLIACQSNMKSEQFFDFNCLGQYKNITFNPLGDWTGGTDVDTGATNRKLGSDMGDSVTGGGIHGKDLSKADVSVNIYAFLKAQATGKPVEICCSIGDEYVDGIPYEKIVSIAKQYINSIGGFEEFAKWGLIR